MLGSQTKSHHQTTLCSNYAPLFFWTRNSSAMKVAFAIAYWDFSFGSVPFPFFDFFTPFPLLPPFPPLRPFPCPLAFGVADAFDFGAAFALGSGGSLCAAARRRCAWGANGFCFPETRLRTVGGIFESRWLLMFR